MLKIRRSSRSKIRVVAALSAVVLVTGGGYLASLVGAPTLATLTIMKPITVSALPAPSTSDNRIIIPKIGVNIPYNEGIESLDRGAQWRHPERGNPETGGNFIIAAHRFSIQPTPVSTIEKSPFYNIDKLEVGDKIIADYNGVRYGYEVTELSHVTPNQTEIESPTEDARLTLYSCELDGSASGRIVVTASLLGKVAVN